METNNKTRRALGIGLEELFNIEDINYDKVEEKIMETVELDEVKEIIINLIQIIIIKKIY